MAQDLRDLFKEDRKGVQQTNMLNGHEKRFEQLLAQRMPQQEVEEPQTNTNNRCVLLVHISESGSREACR